MPGRKFNAGSEYRYGFNGKEDDGDISEGGQDYGMRIYDGRLGKFLSIDPIASDYPELTPFQFSSNNPVFNIDWDGLEGRPWYTYGKSADAWTRLVTDNAPKYYTSLAKGFLKSGWNSVKGIATLSSPVLTPQKVQQTAAMAQAITHPKQTLSNTKAAVKQWGKNLMSSDPAVAGNAAGQGLEFAAEMIIPGAIIKSGTSALSVAKKLTIPQGIMAEEFQVMSQRVVNAVGDMSDDIVVQGSRAAGTATIVSDIDIAVKVGAKEFDQLITKAFGTPNKGSALEKTMLHAIETGKINSGRAGFSKIKENIQTLLGMKVDMSIIKKGGAFDNGAQIPVKGIKIP